jgi:hypothetical protein
MNKRFIIKSASFDSTSISTLFTEFFIFHWRMVTTRCIHLKFIRTMHEVRIGKRFGFGLVSSLYLSKDIICSSAWN